MKAPRAKQTIEMKYWSADESVRCWGRGGEGRGGGRGRGSSVYEKLAISHLGRAGDRRIRSDRTQDRISGVKDINIV